jgi:dTMP kinase
MQKGLFVSVEGIEGVGKSTAMSYIQGWLKQQGVKFITTREPGGTPLAEEIRSLLLSSHEESVSDMTELLLMFAARSQNVSQVIQPALAEGLWVLADRFTDASMAYQGGGRGIDLDVIAQLAVMVQGNLVPDCTLLLDAPVEVGRQRIEAKNVELDRIELEQVAFFERVRQQYLAMAQAHARFQIIDATQSIETVQQSITEHLNGLLIKQEVG